jgi:prepilin-type processing-associated H-X9-DG protein/prepilin-type N-terminal cleavage/methylation domain-containing protein
MPSRRRAFTLVELLVVIGILVVLIAVLLPAVVRARQQAIRLKCQSNLRSIGHGLTMYVQQYRYYPGAAASSASGMYGVWPVRIRPFVGGEQSIFDCPAEDSDCEWKKNAPPRPAAVLATADDARFGYDVGEPLITLRFSYGYNHFGTVFSYIDPKTGTHRGLGLATIPSSMGPIGGELSAGRVRRPSEMIAITDSNADGKQDYLIWPSVDGWGPPGLIHSGGANVLFCDGHVQWYLQKDLVVESWGENPRYFAIRRMWNNDNQP